MKDPRHRLGSAGEDLATRFLRHQGYEILVRNFRCHGGEIDLVCLERGTLVFVEVKTRGQLAFGSAFEAVDSNKRTRLRRAARFYLTRHRLHGHPARFDVVAIWWSGTQPRCELLRNAFGAGS